MQVLASLLAAHHILFTLSLLFNIIVMSVYWPLIHSVNMQKPEYQYPLPQYYISYLIHTVPFAASVYNFCTVDAVLKPNHIIAVLPLEAAFLFINYNATIASGKPLYWFLDW